MTQTPSTPQAGNAGTDPQPQAGDPQPTPQAGSGKTPEDYERMIADLRKENAGHRTKLKKFEDDETQRTQAQMSEQEKLQKTAADLQSKYDSDTSALTERIVRYEVERQAARLGIIDPDAAAQLIDWDALEYDEDGTPRNADTLLKDLLKAKPYLAGKAAPSTAGGATNPGRASANTAQLSWDIITKMTPEQYEARRAEIQQWMRTAPMKRF